MISGSTIVELSIIEGEKMYVTLHECVMEGHL